MIGDIGASLQFRFSDGELEIDTGSRIMRIRCRPEPRAHFRETGGEWREFRPAFRLIFPAAAEDKEARPPGDQKQQALLALRNSLPAKAAGAIERFQSYQWNLIDLLYRSSEALDLACSNPALAYCLANNDEFVPYCRKAPAARAMDHVNGKQREIAAWLGFPGTEPVVRIFRKIPNEAINPHQGRLLRRAMNEAPETIKLLAHVPIIHEGVLALVTNLKLLPAVSPGLLIEISQKEKGNERQPAADLLVNAIYQFHQLKRHDRIPCFDSIRSISRFHESNLRELRRREVEHEAERRRANEIIEEERRRRQQRQEEARKRAREKLPKLFPQPPVNGTEDIIPLTTKEQLEHEGLSQRNCVASYHSNVSRGRIYVYAVIRPERATLAIGRGLGTDWHILELYAAGNKPVRQATRALVEQWLSRYNSSKPAQ